MRIVEINSCNFGSTGNIMQGIADVAAKHGHSTLTCVPKSRDNSKKVIENQIFIGNRISRNLHLKLGRQTGYQGCFSVFSTWNFLRKLSKYKPDLIHLHNLHNCYINQEMLFTWIKKYNVPVVWTLHDCWSFTGKCPHFTMAKCDRWKNGCGQCKEVESYPESKVDRTQKMWSKKKKCFTGLSNMTIVTPSKWLADLAKESFLQDYPVQVINNGIDLKVFKPTESDFRIKHGIGDKKMLLGVAFGWGERKGLDVFLELAKKLDAEKYQIVLVGTDESIDKMLPKNIISIHRTQNQKELAEIYTAADVFVNPTREDNYPTVNMEAIACGTPVITFQTGGSPEILDESIGLVAKSNTTDGILECIHDLESIAEKSKENCLARARSFDKEGRFEEYVSLFEKMKYSARDFGKIKD